MPFTIPRPSFGRRHPAEVASAPGRGANESIFDEEMLARLRRMVLLSPRSIAEGLAGEHRSRRHGSSPEFADFKSYSQGDDFRRIDWNTYARLDGLFVRLSEVTTELSIHILLDASNSMDWRGSSRVSTKSVYARRVAGALGYVALWHFDRLSIVPFGTEVAPSFGPSQGRSHVIPMLRFLEGLRPLGQTNVADTVDRYVRLRRRPGILVIVSDLLSGEPDDLRRALRTARARGWHTTVLHILDEAEVTPALAGRYLTATATAGGIPPAELLEVESGERLRLSPTDEVLDRYGAAIGAWQEELETACTDERAEYVQLLTSWSIESIVLRQLHARGVIA